MSKKNVIAIDLNTWSTQQQYARDNNVPLNRISQRIKRTKAGKTVNPVTIWEIPELNNIVLIKKV